LRFSRLRLGREGAGAARSGGSGWPCLGGRRNFAVKPAGDDRDHDVIFHFRVDYRAEDDVCIWRYGVADDRGRLIDFADPHVAAAGKVDDHTASAVDRRIQQRAVDRLPDGIGRAAFAGSAADSHVADACLGHDAADIGQVEIDQSGHRNQVGNAGNAVLENLIGKGEGFIERGVFGCDLQQLVIGHDNQGVDIFLHFADAAFGILHAARPFKTEGPRDDTDRQDTQFPGDLGDDRGPAGAGSAAHAGRDEQHVGTANQLGDFILRLVGGFLADFGIGAGPESAGDFLADLDPIAGIGPHQRLVICVDRDEFDALHIAVDHAVNRVASAAADAYDLDGRKVIVIHSKSHFIV